MVESVGKKLNQARLKRGLTIDEAAHATKLRPDKIAALESDDYSRFANNIYAKGFLQIYARFLNVDVSEFARTLDNANPISVSDYQYLSNAPTPRRETTTVQREERKPPSLAPLLVFVVLIGIFLLGSWGDAKYKQINDKTEHTAQTTSGETATVPAATPEPVIPKAVAVTPAPAAVQTVPTPIPQPAPATGTPAVVRTGPTPAAASPAPLHFSTPAPGATPSVARTEPPKSSDQDFVKPTPVDPSADPASRQSLPGGVNEVQVAAVKKTWVTVRRDDPKAAPIFEDYIYPSANPLKLKGARFYIDAREPNAVQITKNGLPFAYQAPNVPVQ
jgi:cytoskeletal protein RodZ